MNQMKPTNHDLTADKNRWLLNVFMVYLSAMLGFAGVYFLIYKYQPGSFAFNSDILLSQRDHVANSIQKELNSTLEESSLLEELLTAPLQEGSFSPNSSGNTSVSVRAPTAKYILDTTPASLSGSVAVQSKLRVERADGSVKVILHSPIYPLPASLEDLLVACRNWRSELVHRIEALTRKLTDLSAPEPDVWTFADFVYFSAVTQATVGYGDILPNKTIVRVLVTVQTILSATLVVVVINWASHHGDAGKLQTAPDGHDQGGRIQ